MRRHTGLWISVWFGALLIFNLWAHWTQNTGRSGLYRFLEALSYVTAPIQLLLSAAMVLVIVAVGKTKSAGDNAGLEEPHSPGTGLRKSQKLVIVLLLATVAGSATFYLLKSGVKHVAIESPRSQPETVAPYQLMSPATAELGTADDGLSPETKQRMRETLALQLSGLVQKQNSPMRVDVLGDHHEVLQFELASMNDDQSSELMQELTQGDRNFWNAMRLMNYEQVVFSGNAYKKIVSRNDFIGYGKDFEKYKAAFLKATTGLQAGARGELGKP